MQCPKCKKEAPENAMYCAFCGSSLAELYSDDNENVNDTDNTAEDAIDEIDTEEEETELIFDEPKKKFNLTLKKANGKKGLSRLGLILVIVGSIIGATLIMGGVGCAVYFNSTSYKISKTVSLIDEKQYADAYNELAGINNDTADALRNYISIPQALDNYKAEYDKIGYVIVNDEYAYMVENMNSFCELVASYGEGNKVQALPPEIKADYDYLKKACENASSIDLTIDFTTSMASFRNDIICNQNSQFTLEEVQNNVDSTNLGLPSLETNIGLIADASNDNTPLDLNGAFFVNYKADYDRFVTACTTSAQNYSTTVEAAKKSNYAMNQPVANKNKNPNYKANVIHNLNPIGSEDDINANAQIMNNTLCVTLFEYYILNMK